MLVNASSSQHFSTPMLTVSDQSRCAVVSPGTGVGLLPTMTSDGTLPLSNRLFFFADRFPSACAGKKASRRLALIGTHIAAPGDGRSAVDGVEAEPTANVFKKYLFDVWYFNDWNGNPDEEEEADADEEEEEPAAPAAVVAAVADVDFAADPVAWRQFCADARDAGVKVPMVYPHSEDKEAALRAKLDDLSGSPGAAAEAEADNAAATEAAKAAAAEAASAAADAAAVTTAESEAEAAGVDLSDLSEPTAWRAFCAKARAQGVKIPMIYPHSPAREASLMKELDSLISAEVTARRSPHHNWMFTDVSERWPVLTGRSSRRPARRCCCSSCSRTGRSPSTSFPPAGRGSSRGVSIRAIPTTT